MRNEKIVDLGGDEKVILLEVRVSDVREYKQLLSEKMDKGIVDLMSTVGVDFVARFSNMKIERVLRLSFSEIELLENAFKELNAPLFKYSELLGIKKLLGKVYGMAIKEISENLNKIIEAAIGQAITKGSEEPSLETKEKSEQESEQQVEKLTVKKPEISIVDAGQAIKI